MKHQIALVGGQLLPVFLGIKEFLPDKLHLIVSPESKNKIPRLKSLLNRQSISEYICDPFSFTSTINVCNNIIQKTLPGDEVQFNLTGGTKVMVLAAQAVINEFNVQGFYINQSGSFTQIPSFKDQKLTSTIAITEFLALTGHAIVKSKKLVEYSSKDFDIAWEIFKFCDSDYRFKQIMKYFSVTYKHSSDIPEKGSVMINKRIEVKWNTESISINEKHKQGLMFTSKGIRSIFFNSGWWELVVASEISKRTQGKELLLNVELPFKSDKNLLKNEIDILLNYNSKLIFIECKSGRVYADDINKIKVIQEIYGGLISKSILVCLEAPGTNILEKCEELGIEVFYYKFGNIRNGFQRLQQSIDKVVATPSI